jgi:lactate dehydrogenase-like 2-hydroxyacid dehydrogenase
MPDLSAAFRRGNCDRLQPPRIVESSLLSPSKPDCLLLNPLSASNIAELSRYLTVHDASDRARRDEIADAVADRIRSVLTIGTVGLTADMIARLPALEIVSTLGVGYEGVDLAAVRARNLVMTHGRGANAVSVADHAMALLLAAMRGVASGDRAVRSGGWRTPHTLLPQATGKRLGILGLGTIGLEIARRGAGGFGMSVAYHNRRERDGVAYRYCPDMMSLAAQSDILVLAAPGGPETHHIVDGAVLDALGPEGFVVNVARGSLIDTTALVAALHAGRIAGAALDVVEGEPDMPAGLLDAPNLVVTPHVAGRSPESNAGMIGLFLANVRAHFAGEPPPTPVPQ